MHQHSSPNAETKQEKVLFVPLTSIDDFLADWQTAIPATFHAIAQLDGDTKKFILHTLKKLASLGIKNVSLLGKEP